MGKTQGSLPERGPAEDAGACTDDSAYIPQDKNSSSFFLTSQKNFRVKKMKNICSFL
jgi:hypothetical protein